LSKNDGTLDASIRYSARKIQVEFGVKRTVAALDCNRCAMTVR
jgi:hypothetical protein